MNYTLSAILQAHTSDVKDLTFLSDTRLASCSRDHSVIVWDLPSKTPTQYFQTHTAYVNALCHLTNVSSPTSYVVSAGTDHLILIHDVNTGECIHSLQGHTNNVCVLASMVPSENNQDMMFISGSWDKYDCHEFIFCIIFSVFLFS
ncbi:hypothetical protein HMI56_006100 [Coelomomyces lativittatus]|nr:hypothetical protein HMI56_006100 [Coelomomyces lativittatus]